VLNKEKGTLCEDVGIHRTIMLKEHRPTLSCIVTASSKNFTQPAYLKPPEAFIMGRE